MSWEETCPNISEEEQEAWSSSKSLADGRHLPAFVGSEVNWVGLLWMESTFPDTIRLIIDHTLLTFKVLRVIYSMFISSEKANISKHMTFERRDSS